MRLLICGAHHLLQEASELAQAAAFHLARVRGLRLERLLHKVELGDCRRGIQFIKQIAAALEKLLRDIGYACGRSEFRPA